MVSAISTLTLNQYNGINMSRSCQSRLPKENIDHWNESILGNFKNVCKRLHLRFAKIRCKMVTLNYKLANYIVYNTPVSDIT